jgi:hypothetical protein
MVQGQDNPVMVVADWNPGALPEPFAVRGVRPVQFRLCQLLEATPSSGIDNRYVRSCRSAIRPVQRIATADDACAQQGMALFKVRQSPNKQGFCYWSVDVQSLYCEERSC